MRTSLDKKLLLFLFIILLFGFITGLTILFTNNLLDINNIILNIKDIKPNYIIIHLIILSILIITSFLLIGSFLNIIFIFFNGLSLSIIIYYYIKLKGINGLLFSIIYIISSKLIFIILLFILSKALIKLVLLLIRKIVLKENKVGYISNLFIKSIILYVLIIINDFIVYFFSNNIINMFIFLIN